MLPSVQIKGIREGLLVTLGEGEWDDITDDLYRELDEQAEFLSGAKIILDVENHSLSAATMGKLRDNISEKGLSLWAILSHSPTTEKNAQVLGLATRIHESHPDDEKRGQGIDPTGDEGILVRKTLRSGHSIQHPGHITVIGDVNPGAEIIAGGDIVIWGRLGGMAHAGAEGDANAVVCALNLSPTQLRIAELIAVAPQDSDERRPEIALVRDNKVVAEPWISSGK
jgi:septum site-determining protein MinC